MHGLQLHLTINVNTDGEKTSQVFYDIFVPESSKTLLNSKELNGKSHLAIRSNTHTGHVVQSTRCAYNAMQLKSICAVNRGQHHIHTGQTGMSKGKK